MSFLLMVFHALVYVVVNCGIAILALWMYETHQLRGPLRLALYFIQLL